MGQDSKIEWTDHTFNAWWGCTKIAPACDHCYAETFAHRLGKDVWGPGKPRPIASTKYWREPFKWNAEAAEAGVRRRVFCASMADVCEDREDLLEPRARLMRLIEQTPMLDWLLLTKRPENFEPFFGRRWSPGGWPRNVVAMATAENQERLDRNVFHLLRCGALRRGLSLEPLLESVTLEGYIEPKGFAVTDKDDDAPDGEAWGRFQRVGERWEPIWPRIDWVIVGGESGNGARPMHPEWARALRDQCADADIAFHFKQWGEWAPYNPMSELRGQYPTNHKLALEGQMIWLGKKVAGRLLDGRTHDAFPDLEARRI